MRRRTCISAWGGLAACWFAPGVASAAIADPAWLMEGAWLVSLEGETRDRFLILSGLHLDQGRLIARSTSYGYLDGGANPVRQWQAVVEADAVRLQFLTPSDSRIEATLKDGDTALEGEFTSPRGKRTSIRMTKLPLQELAEIREARKLSAKVSTLAVRSTSKITLLYAGASDCPACMGYEAEFFGRKNLMALRLPEFPEISYLKVSLASYRGARGLAQVLPPELASLATVGPNGGQPKLSARGTPYFAAIVDGMVLAQAHGITGLESLVIPALRQAVAMRQKAG